MDDQQARLWHLYELDRALRLIRLGAGHEAISHGRLVLLWLQIYDRVEE